jgi:para-nitrobenzyl esterase
MSNALRVVVIVSLIVAIANACSTRSRSAGASDGLAETSWQLVRFEGGDGQVRSPDDRTKYTVRFNADGSVNVRLDCNRGRGTWKVTSPPQLELGSLALTRVACPEGSMHDQIARQWTFVRSYLLRAGHLFLSLMADGGIYEFEPAAAAPARSSS